MADLKHDVPTKLLWLDMEMTGLDPSRDRILEVAAIATDFEFNELGRFESVVGQDPAHIRDLFEANPWYREFPENTKYFLERVGEAPPEAEVERAMGAFVDDVFKGEPAVLAGNSIHNDRIFIKAWWQVFDKKLHYRMVDVSSFKIVMQAKYAVNFEKHVESHRALDDILESIDELKHYLQWLAERRSPEA